MNKLNLTDEQKKARGLAIALALGLPKSRGLKDSFDCRWDTWWGTKTSLGLYNTLERMFTEKDVESLIPPF